MPQVAPPSEPAECTPLTHNLTPQHDTWCAECNPRQCLVRWLNVCSTHNNNYFCMIPELTPVNASLPRSMRVYHGEHTENSPRREISTLPVCPCKLTTVSWPMWAYQCELTIVSLPRWAYQCELTNISLPSSAYQCQLIKKKAYQSQLTNVGLPMSVYQHSHNPIMFLEKDSTLIYCANEQ